MPAILLDARQTSVLALSHESVQVCDEGGTPLGLIVPHDARQSQLGQDHWIDCWNEWYAEPDEEEQELPQTD